MNIPFERPERLLVESLIQRQQRIEQMQAQLNADVEETYRFLERVHGLEANAIGSTYLLTVDGLIKQESSEPSESPPEDGYKYNEEDKPASSVS